MNSNRNTASNLFTALAAVQNIDTASINTAKEFF